jgi:hypothetical protein
MATKIKIFPAIKKNKPIFFQLRKDLSRNFVMATGSTGLNKN